MKLEIDKPQHIARVTGSVPTSGLVDDVDRIDDGLEQMDGAGMQISEHPAKNQPKTMRYF